MQNTMGLAEEKKGDLGENIQNEKENGGKLL